jgi:hypothetical protein
MKKTLIIAALFCAASMSSFAQKKVAVVSFFCDKYIGTEQLDGAGSVVGLVAKLAENPDFNLKPALDDFYNTFNGSYSSQFPFDFIPEADVTGNEKYKAFETDFKGIDLISGGDPAKRFETIDGYKPFYELFSLKKKELAAEMLGYFPDADGVMFIFLSYEFIPKVAVGGMGTAGIKAYVNMRLYNKEGKKVFNMREGGTSKKTVAMIKGIPVMKPAEITPMCLNATEKLVKDLNKKVGKLAGKADKKL